MATTQCVDIGPFPMEIIDLLMDDVAEVGGQAALIACTRVSRNFYISCQRKVYRKVFIQHHHNQSNLANFHRLLVSSPYVQDYVQEIDFGFHTSNDDEESCLRYQTNLATILRLLPRLTSLALKFTCSGQLMDWSKFPEDLKSGILATFGLPTMKSVALHGIEHFPQDVLESLVCHLEHLELKDVTPAASTPHSNRVRPKLASLALLGRSSMSALVIARTIAATHLQTLRTLIISPSRKDNLAAAGWYLAGLVSANLTHFEWRPVHDNSFSTFMGPHIPDYFRRFPNLSSITLEFPSLSVIAITEVAALLMRLRSKNAIRTLTIRYESACVSLGTYNGPEWQYIDRIVTAPQYALEHFVFELSSRSGVSEEMRRREEELIDRYLPLLKQRGVLGYR